MKRIALVLAMIVMGTTLFAQAKDRKNNDEINTLIEQNGKVTHGWFIGLQSGYTQLKGHDTWMGGIAAGWIINHNFTIGISGMGFADGRNLYFDNIQDTLGGFLEGGYGGLLIEYTLFPKSAVHVTFPVTIGGGNLTLTSKDRVKEWDDNKWEWNHKVLAEDAFFVVEPGIRVELNVVKWLRLNAGLAYRYVPDLNMKEISPNLLNNLTATVGLKFGKF